MNVNLTWKKKKQPGTDDQQEFALSADPKRELYRALILLMLYKGADRSNEQQRVVHHRIGQLAKETEPAFVARLAVCLQERFQDRGLSFFLSAILTLKYNKDEWLMTFTNRILDFPSAIPGWLEIYARTAGLYGAKQTHRTRKQLAKVLSPAFNRIDEFQYTRYTSEQQQGIREAILKVRPAAKDRDQKMLFEKIIKNQLPARNTWYEELDKVSRLHYDSLTLKRLAIRNKWGELILTWKISYEDLLDHLPVLLQAGVGGKALQLVAQYIGNAGAVSKNGLLVFRYLRAYRAVRSLGHPLAPAILETLEKAAILSAGNIPGFTADTRVLVAMDVSNSMKRRVEEDGVIDCFDIGPLLGMLLSFRCTRVTTGLFGNIWKPVILPGKNILGELDAFQSREGEVGYAANGYEVIRELIRKRQVVDKVLVFTDCRLWDNRQPNQPPGTDIGRLWKQYKQMAPHAQLYLFDLAAYGDSPFEPIPDDVFLVAGWNDKIFSVIEAIEKAACL